MLSHVHVGVADFRRAFAFYQGGNKLCVCCHDAEDG
jgi:hypothetical protein